MGKVQDLLFKIYLIEVLKLNAEPYGGKKIQAPFLMLKNLIFSNEFFSEYVLRLVLVETIYYSTALILVVIQAPQLRMASVKGRMRLPILQRLCNVDL